MISPDTIEEVKNRIDIVDVVSDFLTLKKVGKDYRSLSPFTQEKTPSFFVVPAKGIFKDFSSGKVGDAIAFIMEHERMGYLEAIRYLAAKYGVPIKEVSSSSYDQDQYNEQEALHIALAFARDYYRDQLWKHQEGIGVGLSYCKSRNYSEDTIKKFELGFASAKTWDHFTKEALAGGYSLDVLEKSGLVIRKQENHYDRFRERIIFPIHHLSGKVIAFSGRILGQGSNAKSTQPKYINSPESEIYQKSTVLYGLYQARQAIRQHDMCYLVEGYTDVISMSQAGIENVVASGGTSLTDDQIKHIRRFTSNITVVFDADQAGIRAALRGIDLILKKGLHVRIVLLPEGEDPDSYVQTKSKAEFQEFILHQRQDFISFKSKLVTQEAGDDPIKKAQAIRDITTTLALVPDPIVRNVYIRQASSVMGIQELVLLTEINKILLNQRKQKSSSRDTTQSVSLEEAHPSLANTPIDASSLVQLQERESIKLLLKNIDEKEGLVLNQLLIDELSDVPQFQNPLYQQIFDEFVKAHQHNTSIHISTLLHSSDQKINQLIADLLIEPSQPSPNWSNNHVYFEQYSGEKSIIKHITRFKYRLLKLRYEILQKKLKQPALTADDEAHVLTELMTLQQAEKTLASQLGIDSGKY